MTEPRLIDTNVSLVDNGCGDFAVRFEQDIPDDFLQDLQDRFVGKHDPSGELLCVAVIPTVIIDRWWREGFRYTEHTHAEMVARLHAESMQKFITTSKRI
jgi:hypothetical protein